VLKWYTSGIDKTLDPGAFSDAEASGWATNVFVFSGAYVVAVILWLGFDATKPIDKDGEAH
jgi:hypothetical protein